LCEELLGFSSDSFVVEVEFGQSAVKIEYDRFDRHFVDAPIIAVSECG